MRYLLILPLFFLSGLSYSTPEVCQSLKDKMSRAKAAYDQALADRKKTDGWHIPHDAYARASVNLKKAKAAYNQALADRSHRAEAVWNKAHADYFKVEVDYHKARKTWDEAHKAWGIARKAWLKALRNLSDIEKAYKEERCGG